jgi:hypothetical protein
LEFNGVFEIRVYESHTSVEQNAAPDTMELNVALDITELIVQ